jgi:hypothetical protein
MAIPLQIQLFDAFLGSQEGIHSIILPDIFSSGGSKNVFIDKFARVAQIGGYTKQNASAYTTDTGASAATVRSLIPYRGTAGGSIARKLLFVLDDGTNEWEVWVSSDNGATASFLYDAGAGSINIPADFAQFNDDLYITTGKTAPRVYDGTSIAAVGRTQSPTITASESANSGNLIGNYRYKLVSTIAGVRQAGSVSSTSVLCSFKQMSLSWTADANTSVDGYEIYRTTGNGTTYYYLTSIDGRLTAAYTDNTSDFLLLEQRVLEEHGDNPPSAYFCEPHKSRMWWLRTDANPTRGYWSDPGDPESVYAENYLDFSDSETVGDQITGGLGNYEGLFVVFTEKALWTVSGTGAVIGDIVDFTKTRTNTGTGSVSHRSDVRIPAGSKYSDQTGQIQTTSVASIAYFTPLGDIRLFDGDNDLIVSHPLKDTLREFNFSQRHKIHAVIDSANDQAIWFFPTSSNGEPNKCAVWNYRYGVWYVWETMPFSSACELDTTDDAALLLVGQSTPATGGYIYKFLDGTSFDGANIEAQWMTKTLYGVNEQGQPAITNRKRWRWIDVLFRIDADVDITVEWLNGGAPNTASAIASVIISPNAETLVSANGSVILTADGSSISLAAETAQKKALLATSVGDYLHDEGIRLRIKTNSTAGAWALEAFQLAFQILPGMKRRDQE